MLKHALWLALFVAAGALAQEAAISGADFTQGKADAQLSALGRQAAAKDRTIVVTAPSYWQSRAAAKIRAGAHGRPVTIRFSNGFYENVLVRTEARAVPATKPAPRAALKRKPKPLVARAAPQRERERTPPVPAKPMPMPNPVREPTPVVTRPMPGQSPAIQAPVTAVPQVANRPVAVPIPTLVHNPTAARVVLPERAAFPATANIDGAARQRLLAGLNNGRPAMGSLNESGLSAGDQIYSDGNTLAVVRLEGLHRDLYWLQGPVDLDRLQYSPLGNGRYQVNASIDPARPAVHRAQAGDAHHVVAATVPAAGSAGRQRLERLYNDGRVISNRLGVRELRQEDRLLVDRGAIVVVRREGNSMARYWLDGSIDLGQIGVQKIDANVYRVAGNRLR